MRLIYSAIIFSLLIACESASNVSSPIDTTKEEIQADAKLDTSLVVPVNDDRIGWQKPDEVIKFLGDLSGESVADIGAGTGYFSFRLALKADKVIALDIDPNMIQLMDAIEAELPDIIQNRFETRLVGENDANLAENEVDNIIIINTIAFIGNKRNYLENLKKGLKKGGKLMIVDYKMKRLAIDDGPNRSDRIPHYQIEDLLIESGYTILTSDDTTLDYQYIVVGQLD